MDLYRQQLLDHYHQPRNWGLTVDYDHQHTTSNQLCGDSITVQTTMHDDTIGSMRIAGQGCVISIAAASVLSEYVPGKTSSEVAQLNYHDIERWLQLRLPPARISCATLALTALKTSVN